jgi:hypothetical protein
MAQRHGDDAPIDEAAAMEAFLRELKRDSPAGWMTGAPDPTRGFWAETDEDYGVGPTGPIGPVGPVRRQRADSW